MPAPLPRHWRCQCLGRGAGQMERSGEDIATGVKTPAYSAAPLWRGVFLPGPDGLDSWTGTAVVDAPAERG